MQSSNITSASAASAANVRLSLVPPASPTTGRINMQHALERFHWVRDTSQVLYRTRAGCTTFNSIQHIEECFAESMENDRETVVKAWARHPYRIKVERLVWQPSQPFGLVETAGLPEYNTFQRWERQQPSEAALLDAQFLWADTVRLFGDRADNYLDWLAHLEQRPGELPHTMFLHISPCHGLGRSGHGDFLAEVFRSPMGTRYVNNALQMRDLVGCFNDGASEKVLVILPELREGSASRNLDDIKQASTAEARYTNGKYQRKKFEYNVARWLLFSNHIDALPLDVYDRRVEVVRNASKPEDAAYYTRRAAIICANAAGGSPERVKAAANAFGWLLAHRDISGFNPGAHAKLTSDKRALIEATESDAAANARLLTRFWKSDLIPNSYVCNVLKNGESKAPHQLTRAFDSAMEAAGIARGNKVLRVGETLMRYCILRNGDKWHAAVAQGDTDALREEINRAPLDLLDDPLHLAFGDRFTPYDQVLAWEGEAEETPQ